MRLDQYVILQHPQLSRSAAVRLIEQAHVMVNGEARKTSYPVKDSDEITISIPETKLETIKLPVVFEDENVIVIDKPAGVLVHSKGSFNSEATVASFIADKVEPSLQESNRGGIVHRLDRDTSGIMICAKTQAAQSFLQKQFAQRKTKKRYLAIVPGKLSEPEAIITWPIARNPKKPQTFRVHANGKTAETHYKVLEQSNTYSLLELTPTTGRTHQLRVHLAHLGHPIVGDRLYGKEAERLYLHAAELEITLPGGERRVFRSPEPAAFKTKLQS